ncbi:MAG: DUF4340 domain-containing protein, partial [Verrucomicrobia bacterium]|nr:DUF4340 domain-containing protein [Verrucomicrobiota bacterium]
MNRKLFLGMFVGALLLGIIGAMVLLSRSSGWENQQKGRTIFGDLPVSEVTQVLIRSSTASLTLEKKDQSWTVAERYNYPADSEKIRDLIRNLWELKPVRDLQIGASQLGRLNLKSPDSKTDSGIAITFNVGKEKQSQSLIIGKSIQGGENSPSATGRFIYVPSNKGRVYVVAQSFNSVDPIVIGDWLDKQFISPGELKEIEQTAWSNNPGWKVTRESSNSSWHLANATSGEKINDDVSARLGYFSPTFSDVRSLSDSSEETGLQKPFRVTVVTFDGFLYVFLIGKQNADKQRFIRIKVDAQLQTARAATENEKP